MTVENIAQPEPFVDKVNTVRITIDEHYELLRDSDILRHRERRKAQVQLRHALDSALVDEVIKCLSQAGGWDSLLQALTDKSTDPYTLAEGITSVIYAPDWNQKLANLDIAPGQGGTDHEL